MTGYGRACKTLHGREITVELRSVNNRFLDCSVRLPRAFSYAEDAIKQLVKDAVQRGKVDVFVSVNAAGAEEATVSLNRPVLEGYLRAMRTMVADYGVQDDISASALSALPDIFVVEKPEEDEKQNLADLTAVAAEAIAVYQTMRETEARPWLPTSAPARRPSAALSAASRSAVPSRWRNTAPGSRTSCARCSPARRSTRAAS